MRMTSARFLEEACRWAYDHGTRHIDDDEFLPHLKSGGISDPDIDRFKNELERRDEIRNYPVIGGMRDLEISKAIFRQYLRRRRFLPTLWPRPEICMQPGPDLQTVLSPQPHLPNNSASPSVKLAITFEVITSNTT